MQFKVSLSSIILFVRDVDLLKDFYTRIFQLEIIEETPQMWVLLKAGSISIGLHRVGDQYLGITDSAFKAGNNVKIVFEISDDIHHVRDYLLQNHVAVKEVKTFENYDY